MTNILNRCKYSFLITILLYVQAFVYCSFEFLNISFGALSMDTGLIFVGLMMITLYFYIINIPTTIVPKITSIRLLLIVIVTMLLSVFINSTVLSNYIFENILLMVSFVWIMWRLKKCINKVKGIKLTDYEIQEFKIYKLHELNILNMLLYMSFMGAIALLGLTVTTICYAVAVVPILLTTNYMRMTKPNFRFGSKKWFVGETVGIILSISYILMVGYLEWSLMLKLITIIPASIYFYTTFKLWAEYHAYLYKK